MKREVGVSTAVKRLAAVVSRAIDLDGEPMLGSEEVDDGVREDDLPAEFGAELSTAEGLPEDSLGGCGMAAQVLGAGSEKGAFVTKRWKQKAHRDLRAGERAGFEPSGADGVPAARSESRRTMRPLARRVRHSSTPALSSGRGAWALVTALRAFHAGAERFGAARLVSIPGAQAERRDFSCLTDAVHVCIVQAMRSGIADSVEGGIGVVEARELGE